MTSQDRKKARKSKNNEYKKQINRETRKLMNPKFGKRRTKRTKLA